MILHNIKSTPVIPYQPDLIQLGLCYVETIFLK